MKRLAMLMGGLIGAVLLGPAVREAAAVNLTGTWRAEGGAKCYGLTSGVLPAAGLIDIVIKISPASSGVNVCVDLDRTDLSPDLNGPHRYRGTFFPKSAKSNTAYGILTKKGTLISAENLTGAVGSFTSSFNKGQGALKLKGTLTSGDGSSAIQCTFKELYRLTPEDLLDPGTPCPE